LTVGNLASSFFVFHQRSARYRHPSNLNRNVSR
jgi:hypothetical protein